MRGCIGMRDEYPPFSFDAPYPARVEAEPGAPERNRGHALAGLIYFVKMLLAIPHLIIVIGYAAGVVAWVGFWIVAFTGSFPPGLHRFFHAYLSWVARTAA